MKPIHTLGLALVMTNLGTSAWAAGATQHDAHHPAGTTSASKSMAKKASSDMSAMNAQMKTMEEMHDKMMAAKTPEERTALMTENMKTMQDGMTMMKGMSAGSMGDMKSMQKSDMAAHYQVMEKRMDMMQSMMQMMMDRMTPPAGK